MMTGHMENDMNFREWYDARARWEDIITFPDLPKFEMPEVRIEGPEDYVVHTDDTHHFTDIKECAEFIWGYGTGKGPTKEELDSVQITRADAHDYTDEEYYDDQEKED